MQSVIVRKPTTFRNYSANYFMTHTVDVPVMMKYSQAMCKGCGVLYPCSYECVVCHKTFYSCEEFAVHILNETTDCQNETPPEKLTVKYFKKRIETLQALVITMASAADEHSRRRRKEHKKVDEQAEIIETFHALARGR